MCIIVSLLPSPCIACNLCKNSAPFLSSSLLLVIEVVTRNPFLIHRIIHEYYCNIDNSILLPVHLTISLLQPSNGRTDGIKHGDAVYRGIGGSIVIARPMKRPPIGWDARNMRNTVREGKNDLYCLSVPYHSYYCIQS